MKFDNDILNETRRQLAAEGSEFPWLFNSNERVIDDIMGDQLDGHFCGISGRYMDLMRKKLTENKASDEEWTAHGFGTSNIDALRDWAAAGKLDWMAGAFI